MPVVKGDGAELFFPSRYAPKDQLLNFLIGGTAAAVSDVFQLVHRFGGDS